MLHGRPQKKGGGKHGWGALQGEIYIERPVKRLSLGQVEAFRSLRDHIFQVWGGARVPWMSHSHSNDPPVQQPETLGVPLPPAISL